MKRIAFNAGWHFQKQGEERTLPVDLPHDAQIYEPRAASLPMDSGYFPGGKYTYTKLFDCPAEYAGQVVYLAFDGVYMNATVFINGHEAGWQPYGYIPFLVPIQEHLNIGGSNEITVVADNSTFPNARWYTGSGIYRDVFMYVGAKRHLRPGDVKIHTVSHAPARIAVGITPPEAGDCEAHTDILLDSQVVASADGFAFELDIPDARLWDAEHPHLYQARVRVLCEGVVVDEATETFGIRTIEWDAGLGLRINGKEVLLRGGCIHHDNGLLGAAAFADVEARKVQKLKEAGFNALRSSHNPCSKAMLEACDRLGMYMMDEFTDVWTQHKHKHDYAGQFRDWYQKDLSALVRRDQNHPSVIMYSIGNEVSESASAEGVEYARKMTELVHALDGSRPVTCGINLLLNGLAAMGKGLYDGEGSPTDKAGKDDKKASGSTFINGVMSKMGGIINNVGRMKRFDLASREVFEVLDIAGYNYGSGRYKVDPKQYPHRVTVGSETFPPSLYRNWQAVKQYPNLTGDFMWAAWDYLGEAGIGVVGYGGESGVLKAYPMLLAGTGIIEITGAFRPEVYWSQIIWGLRTQPYISVEPVTHAGEKASFGMWRSSDGRHSWAWRGCEGKTTRVTVYAPEGSVEMRLNGKSLGRRKVKECKAVFPKVSYQPGELRATHFDAAGKATGEDILKSADGELGLKIEPECEGFEADKLIFTNLELADAAGIREHGLEKAVQLAVDGGTLLAFGSANPEPGNGYHQHTHTTYYGAVQAIIKPDKGAERVRITANAEQMPQAVLTLNRR
ncbi:DUF4982 domain-containing protein [Clostridia bacterium OttesenSCG-928-O13]|nr:DUF4982 domain-containing protein [Clostridia bacterium OttesenSCG-928-O13]